MKRAKSKFCPLVFLLEPLGTESSKCLFLFNENSGIFMIKTYSDNKLVENMYMFPLDFF